KNNDLRNKALQAINEVKWTPAWGEQRIHGMVEGRPDWCVSRQRSWGVPLTVLTCSDCGEILKNRKVCDNIEAMFEKEGADAWFKHEAETFLPDGIKCSCGSTSFEKETDILDVWFDSGVSHAAVMGAREELRSPADLYLEGSDQHRGWFQSSLLASVGTRDQAPFKGVLTHGYVVDGKGKKMSKSIGNVIAPQEMIDKFGAEILRLWVASEDYRDDVKVSEEILRRVSDSYRKLRNTLRFLLSNLNDFDPVTDSVDLKNSEAMSELDRWALARYADLVRRVDRAYSEYEFHAIYHSLINFCGTTISSLYMDVLKDRLYCSAPNAPERRAVQTVIYRILDGLLRMMAPILTVTAAEAWEHLHGLDQQSPLEDSVFFADFPKVDDIAQDAELDARWERLIALRSEITKVLEAARRDKTIGLSLDAEVLLQVNTDTTTFLDENLALLQELCIVSSLRVVTEAGDAALTTSEEIEGLQVAVQPAPGNKCERCWTISPSVDEDSEHPTLCSRCLAVVKELAG
ncbi:MAG: isoleucine--tRNA ligase, partial [Candidatus Electrothrix sp. AS4_5]|nr:isoleucine--tRNA ligase [Candidatus Electrothrix gigas]